MITPVSGLPARRSPHPLFAYTQLFRLSRDVVGTLDELFSALGPLCTLVPGDLRQQAPLARWVFAYGPEHARTFLAGHQLWHKPPLTKHLYPTGDKLGPRKEALRRWGTGLFGVNEDAHREHRRLLNPVFSKRRTDALASQMGRIVDEELDRWLPGGQIDLRHEMMALTLRIAAACLLGDDVGKGGGRGIGAELQGSIRALLSPAVALLPYDLPGLPYRRFLDGVVRTDEALRAMIAKKRASTGGDDVLSALVEARDVEGAVLTEDELIGHAGVIFIAGHETTSNALMWTMLLLSQHPEVAADLVDEIQAVTGDRPPGPEDFARMPLLDAVIRESMRLLPAVPVTIRRLGYDTDLEGAPVPQGTQLLLSNYHTHRMPEVYADPRRFMPSRWATLRPGPNEYIPFGTGPRVCIGAQFAMTELKVVVSRLLRRFRLELPPTARVDRYLAVALTVRDPLPMRVHAQDREFHANARGFTGTVRAMVDWPA